MAKLYGTTILDPVEAPLGIVGTPSTGVPLPQGFTVPSGKTGTISGTLSVTGSTTLAGVTVSGALSVTTVTTGNVILDGGNARGAALTIGTNDNFQVNFETNGTPRGFLAASGEWNLGASGFTGAHVVNGGIQFSTAFSDAKLSMYSSGRVTGNVAVGINPTGDVTIDFSRIGSMVGITVQGFSGTSAGSGQYISITTNVPVHIRPDSVKHAVTSIRNDTTQEFGLVQFLTTGEIRIFRNAAGDTFSAASGPRSFQTFTLFFVNGTAAQEDSC